MLVAVKHKKDRNIKKEKIVLVEDEITSCVLGPLSYMDTGNVWNLFKRLIPIKVDLWPNETPTSVNFYFWKNIASTGRVEPDVFVRFKRNTEPLLTVIFEVKWGSRLSSERELVNQWRELSVSEKTHSFHVYLVNNVAYGIDDIEDSLVLKDVGFSKKQWRERLVCVGWRDLIDVLIFRRPDFNAPMSLWADNVLCFFERLGLSSFTGYQWLADKKIPTPATDEFFWKITPWFSFLNEKAALKLPANKERRLFWKA